MSDWLLCSFCAETMYPAKEKVYFFRESNKYMCGKCREEWLKENKKKNKKKNKDKENE